MKEILLSTFMLLSIASCVNSDYGFDKVPDDVIIGDKIVLPLGTTGDVFLNELIDIEDVSEINIDKNGGYQFVYSGDFEINTVMPQLEDVVSDGVGYIDTSHFPPLVGIGKPMMLQLIDDNQPITFPLTDEIQRIDSVIFKEGTTKLDVTLNYTGIKIVNTVGKFITELSLPKGSKIKLSDKVTISDDGIYTYTSTFDIINNVIYDQTISIILDKLTEGDINIKIYFDIESAEKIEFESNPEIKTHYSIKDIEFDILYGQIVIKEDIQETFIEIGEIKDVFGEGAVLDFYNPLVNIHTMLNLGADFKMGLDIYGYKGEAIDNQLSTTLSIEGVTTIGEYKKSNYVLSPIDPHIEGSIWQELPINDIIKGNPDKIGVSGVANSVERASMFVTSDSKFNASYDVVIPFSTGSNFKILIEEDFVDIFTEEMADMLFQTGELEFFGTVLNKLPLNLALTIIATDDKDQNIGVDFGIANVTGSLDGSVEESDIVLKIKAEDMHKMINARNLKLILNASSNEELKGIVIKESDLINITLKIRKEGGILLK